MQILNLLLLVCLFVEEYRESLLEIYYRYLLYILKCSKYILSEQ
jgi:hypothetical protein